MSRRHVVRHFRTSHPCPLAYHTPHSTQLMAFSLDSCKATAKAGLEGVTLDAPLGSSKSRGVSAVFSASGPDGFSAKLTVTDATVESVRAPRRAAGGGGARGIGFASWPTCAVGPAAPAGAPAASRPRAAGEQGEPEAGGRHAGGQEGRCVAWALKRAPSLSVSARLPRRPGLPAPPPLRRGRAPPGAGSHPATPRRLRHHHLRRGQGVLQDPP